MKTLTVSLRVAIRASNIISDVKELDRILEPASSNEWLLQTENEHEEENVKEIIQMYFGMVGIAENEYEIEEI